MVPIRVSHHDAVCEIVLDRPGRMNALRDEDFVALTAIVEDVAKSEARAVLIHGANGAFCAGRDISTTDAAALDAEALIRREINPLFRVIRAIPVPTIAAVEGVCLGGGFGIAFACDIVLAAEDARLGSPFRNLGLIPDSGTHHHLLDVLGHHRASELIYTGRLMSGTEAAALGLVNRACPKDELLACARAMAQEIARGPTAAFRASKLILQRAGTFDEVLDQEAEGQGRIVPTRDGIEGFAAFQQKRRPRFVGA